MGSTARCVHRGFVCALGAIRVFYNSDTNHGEHAGEDQEAAVGPDSALPGHAHCVHQCRSGCGALSPPKLVSVQTAHAKTVGRSTFVALSPADAVVLEAPQASCQRSRARQSGLSVSLTAAALRAGQERRRAGRVCQPAPARLCATRRGALRPPWQAQRRAARACRPFVAGVGERAPAHACLPACPLLRRRGPPSSRLRMLTVAGHTNNPFCQLERARHGKISALLDRARAMHLGAQVQPRRRGRLAAPRRESGAQGRRAQAAAARRSATG